jgi:radical SAM protein with 4Fe4S-binding SPASM domain
METHFQYGGRSLLNSRFDVEIPWRIEEGTRFKVILHDRELLGSVGYFLSFDLYTFFAPSHPERHFAYWEIPLRALKHEQTELVFRDGRLAIPGGGWFKQFKPKWKGERELLGYCTLTVSLWRRSLGQRRQLEKKCSDHIALKDERDLPLEAMLVAVSQRCNLKCPFCTREHGEGLEAAVVSEEVFNRVLDECPNLMYVGLQGIGEPLLNPDLFRMVKEVRKRLPTLGRLALTTNGTLMNRDTALQLIDGGLNNITFSVDGATKITYEKNRLGANFESVIGNIAAAVEYGKSTRRKDLWFAANFIIMEDNVQEVPAFVRLAAELGIDTVGFYRGREYPSEQLMPIDESELNRAINEATVLAKELGLSLKLADPTRSRDRICFFMQGVYLWLSGEVLPCHRMEPPGHPWPVRIFGNLKEESLTDIWNKPEYRQYRSQVARGILQEECSGCTHCSSVRY